MLKFTALSLLLIGLFAPSTSHAKYISHYVADPAVSVVISEFDNSVEISTPYRMFSEKDWPYGIRAFWTNRAPDIVVLDFLVFGRTERLDGVDIRVGEDIQTLKEIDVLTRFEKAGFYHTVSTEGLGSEFTISAASDSSLKRFGTSRETLKAMNNNPTKFRIRQTSTYIVTTLEQSETPNTNRLPFASPALQQFQKAIEWAMVPEDARGEIPVWPPIKTTCETTLRGYSLFSSPTEADAETICYDRDEYEAKKKVKGKNAGPNLQPRKR